MGLKLSVLSSQGCTTLACHSWISVLLAKHALCGKWHELVLSAGYIKFAFPPMQEERLRQLGAELKSELCSGSLAHLREMTSAFLQELKASLGRQAQADLPVHPPVSSSTQSIAGQQHTHGIPISKFGTARLSAIHGRDGNETSAHMDSKFSTSSSMQDQTGLTGDAAAHWVGRQHEALSTAAGPAQSHDGISEENLGHRKRVNHSQHQATSHAQHPEPMSGASRSAHSDDAISEEDIALEVADSLASSIPEESQAAVSRPAESVAESVSDYSMAFDSIGVRSPMQGLRSPFSQLHSPLPGRRLRY